MMQWLRPYMLRYRKKLLWGFIFVAGSNLAGILPPIAVKDAINYLQEDVQINTLLGLVGLIVLFTILSGFFRFLMRRTVIVVSRLIENDLRNDLFHKLQSLDRTFFQSNPTGDLMSRLTNDLNAIRAVLGPGLMYTVNLLTSFVFVTAMMLSINSLMTLIILLPVPIMALVVNRLGAVIHKRYLAVQVQFAKISAKAQENLAGIRVVKSYVLEAREQRAFNELNEEYIQKNMAHVRAQAGFQPSMMLIVGIGSALVLLFGGHLIMDGTISLGDFVAFTMYMGMLIWPSIALGWVMGIFLQGTAAHKRLSYIFNSQPDGHGLHTLRSTDFNTSSIQFKNLTFSYPGTNIPVLKNIDFVIPEGQIVAVVGRTGAGKTTLMHLLAGEFIPQEDSLYIGSHDICTLPLSGLRQKLGYIPQDSFLFSDTIRNNIAFGRPDATMEEIEQAARAAFIHESILDMPKGYDTLLGERGINISGGQKQRLSIARAVLKNPEILLLDDSLSAVDTITEETILNNLRAVMQDKTCLWVSHRISSIKNADKIIVIDKGEIVESGTHDELIELKDYYYDMYEKQKLEDSLATID